MALDFRNGANGMCLEKQNSTQAFSVLNRSRTEKLSVILRVFGIREPRRFVCENRILRSAFNDSSNTCSVETVRTQRQIQRRYLTQLESDHLLGLRLTEFEACVHPKQCSAIF